MVTITEIEQGHTRTTVMHSTINGSPLGEALLMFDPFRRSHVKPESWISECLGEVFPSIIMLGGLIVTIAMIVYGVQLVLAII